MTLAWERPLAAPTSDRRALAFIFVTVLVDTIGFGIIIPVLPQLIIELGGTNLSHAARIAGWLSFAYALMQFFCGPLLGNLSDRFGRRPVLIASLIGFSANYAIMAAAPTLALLFVGRVLAGLFGSTFTPAYAYIADVSPPEKRAQNFGLIGLAFGIGFIVGPALGGLLGAIGTRLPFIAAASLALGNALYGIFVLPESLPRERRRPFDIRRASPASALIRLRNLHPAVLRLAAVVFGWQLAQMSVQATWNFYTIYRFGWSEAAVGVSLAAVGLSAAVVGGGLTRVMIPRIGEQRAVILGFSLGVAAFAVYAAASHAWMMYLGIVVGALSGLAYPSLQALMSHRVAPDAQGELQGTVSSLTSLSTIIGPPLMTGLFAIFSGPRAAIHLPGAPFLLSVLLATGSLTLFLRACRTTLRA